METARYRRGEAERAKHSPLTHMRWQCAITRRTLNIDGVKLSQPLIGGEDTLHGSPVFACCGVQGNRAVLPFG
jgi:hypothetical protein